MNINIFAQLARCASGSSFRSGTRIAPQVGKYLRASQARCISVLVTPGTNNCPKGRTYITGNAARMATPIPDDSLQRKPSHTIDDHTTHDVPAGAYYDIGQEYFSGRKVPKNEAKAVEFFLKAAVRGDAKAQNLLGCCYAHSRGVAKDEVESALWWEKAAENGDADAQLSIGVVYANGTCGKQEDAKMAFDFFRAAAAQNNATALDWVGECYKAGFGVEQNMQRATELFHEAADVRLSEELNAAFFPNNAAGSTEKVYNA